MSSSIDLLPSTSAYYADDTCDAPVTKKRRTSKTRLNSTSQPIFEVVPDEEEPADASTSVPLHPLGIRPSGNAYDATLNLKDATGFLACLPEELLLQILDFLNWKDVLQFGATCKALYAYSVSDELWKNFLIDAPSIGNSWRGNWRSTFLNLSSGASPMVDCRGLYSDALYLPFHRAHVNLLHYTYNIPTCNQITRLANLSSEDYNTSWVSKPFILTEPVRRWPIFKKWSTQFLSEKYGNIMFRAEAVDWPLHAYLDYTHNNSDESPLYLFDCRFAEKMGLTVGDSSAEGNQESADYIPPSCFSPDLFTALGDRRPDHRWLIMGPARSGSTFHADPNGTSAWNAPITGKKYWIMFPPSTDSSAPPPDMPGLHISPDGSHITAPLSIAEYLLSFHAAARAYPGCIEAVCCAGEVLHVPSGWYHMVLNIEDGIAITQNFVPRARLPEVLTFLRDKRDQVSGFSNDTTAENKGLITGDVEAEGMEYELFVERLKEQFPVALEEALVELGRRDAKKNKKSRWEELTNKAEATASEVPSGFGFAFGFGTEEEEEDEQEPMDDLEERASVLEP